MNARSCKTPTWCGGWLWVLLGCLAVSAADSSALSTNEVGRTNSSGNRPVVEPTNLNASLTTQAVEAGPTNRPVDPPATGRTEARPDRDTAPDRRSAPGRGPAELGRPVRPDFASFKIVADRNIFNANRSGGPVRSSRETRNPSKVEALRLVGIMDYEKGLFAFFDGTSSDYRKALQSSNVIAGYTLTNVTADGVTLAADGKTYELRVGAQLRREDNGDWQVVSTGEMPAATGGSSASSEEGGDSGGEVSEVLKKLMQQREQE
jgi:hypothetical protein